MKTISLVFVSLSLLASPAFATESHFPTEHADVAGQVATAESRALAAQFYAILYPEQSEPDDTMEMYREWVNAMQEDGTLLSVAQKEDFQHKADALLMQLQNVVEAKLPLLRAGYVEALATEYSSDELRQFISFGQTPAGNHFLTSMPGLAFHPLVEKAGDDYTAAIAPMIEELGKLMCQQSTAMRIAAGDADAKCAKA